MAQWTPESRWLQQVKEVVPIETSVAVAKVPDRYTKLQESIHMTIDSDDMLTILIEGIMIVIHRWGLSHTILSPLPTSSAAHGADPPTRHTYHIRTCQRIVLHSMASVACCPGLPSLVLA